MLKYNPPEPSLPQLPNPPKGVVCSISVKSEYGKGSVFTAQIIQDIEDASVLGEETTGALRNFHYAP